MKKYMLLQLITQALIYVRAYSSYFDGRRAYTVLQVILMESMYAYMYVRMVLIIGET